MRAIRIDFSLDIYYYVRARNAQFVLDDKDMVSINSIILFTKRGAGRDCYSHNLW